MDPWSFRPPVLVGERVVWLGSGTGLPQGGVVRWIGKLPEMGPDWTVGLELDHPLPYGGIDGSWGNRHLFTCEAKHGLIVPITKTVREADLVKWPFNSLETPPPPYCRVESSVMTASTPLADQPTEVGSTASSTVPCSLATGGGGSGDVASRAWCRVAYWELAMRVGRLFAVETPAVDVFGLAPRGDGLCLTTLADGGGGAGGGGSGTTCAGAVSAGGGAATLSCSGASEAVRRTRAKIGQGLTLSCEVDGVWAYNRSEGPIFVNSPTLDDPDARTLLVYRVPPGHCLNIFEHAKAEEARRRRRQWDQLTQSGPTDPNSVRISFAKGWGPKYSRQEVTACPCWLEVLLAPCR